jgi:hypothetical protein
MIMALQQKKAMKPVKIEFTSQVFKEGKMYVAHTPELDLSSCATTQIKAQKNLMEAVRLFLEEAEKKGSLDQILAEAGFIRRNGRLVGPRFVLTQRVTLPLSPTHAQA